MKFEQALQAMREGKEIRRKAWCDSERMVELYRMMPRDDGQYSYYAVAVKVEDIITDDWEIVGEEQSELKIYSFGYLFESNDKMEYVKFDNIVLSGNQPDDKDRVKLHCDMEINKDIFNRLIEHQRGEY